MLISIYKKALHKFLPRSSAVLPSRKEKKKKANMVRKDMAILLNCVFCRKKSCVWIPITLFCQKWKWPSESQSVTLPTKPSPHVANSLCLLQTGARPCLPLAGKAEPAYTSSSSLDLLTFLPVWYCSSSLPSTHPGMAFASPCTLSSASGDSTVRSEQNSQTRVGTQSTLALSLNFLLTLSHSTPINFTLIFLILFLPVSPPTTVLHWGGRVKKTWD